MENKPEHTTKQSAEPRNIFTTRAGHAIALKPWSVDVIAANIQNFQAFISAWAELITPNGTVNANAITNVLPGLRASLSEPTDLDRVSGVAELVDLIKAVWDFNEIGVGLGKALAVQAAMMRDVVGASSGVATLQDSPTP